MTVPVHELRDQIRYGNRSAVEVCRETLGRIERLDPVLHAFNSVTAEQALARLAAHLPQMGPPWTSQMPLPGDEPRLGGSDEFAPGLGRAEVEFLVREEWARTADDILWRRTKAGLTASPEQQQALARYLSAGQMFKRYMPVE